MPKLNMLPKLVWLVSLFCIVRGYELKQILVFSRHNVRSAISNDHLLYTKKQWPTWANDTGELTPRGEKLEKYMGKYFSMWLHHEKYRLNCPHDMYVRANNKQRTIASGKAFVSGAFENCDVLVHSKEASTTDPLFNLAVRNATDTFKKEMLEATKEKLSHVNLMESLKLLQDIIQLPETDVYCDLTSNEHTIKIIVGKEPLLKGPIYIGNRLVDTFMMQYYNGFPEGNVAWGLIRNNDEWKKLLRINAYYHDIIFNTTAVANDISKPLVSYIKDILLNDSKKFTLLVGHDGNIFTMLNILGFKSYDLPEQYEKTPVGGKIVFQKWLDTTNNRLLLKVEYVYQSTKQIRDLEKLTVTNPPKRVTLEMANCPIDQNGFCLWSDFQSLQF